MTAISAQQTPDVALPPGADREWNTEWEMGPPRYRHVFTLDFAPEMSLRGVVTQFADGSIGTVDDQDNAPAVHVGPTDYRPEDARRLAAKIVAVADAVDAWAGHKPPDPNALLIAARDAVERAHNALQTAPGTTANLVRAALYSITAAIEVTR